MLSSKFLKDIMTEAYPIIQRQLEDAKVIASFRELVTANGGDWSALKALMKAHVEDSLDDSGDGKRVRKILDKADSSNAYAEMLGLANMNEKNFISGDDEQEDEEPDTVEALLSNSALGLVRASSLEKPEQQVAPQPASGLTSPLSPKGQVAPIQPEMANEDEVLAAEGLRPGDEASASNGGSQDPCVAGLDMDAAAPSPGDAQPKYAPPGEIVWETHPPEGVERGAISMAFGSMGQDIEVIKDDLAKAAAQPIVKKGNVILDGWARYMAARNMVELDGSPMAYPVVQYDGTDVLTDIIKLNVEGRMLTDQQKRLIAANLARQEPSRKEDIYKAFEVFLEPV